MDQGVPPKSATAHVKVKVLRNQYEPVFVHKSYNITVDEITSYDTNILKVEAVDKDNELQPDVNY